MDPSEVEFAVLYPAANAAQAPRGLPEQVHRAFQAANKVRAVDPNAYAVLLGRVLEIVCQDRQAKGATLSAKIQDLSNRHEIPERLAKVADGLRHLRNVGAHADLGELSESEAPVLDSLTRAILEYVYTAQVLVRDAEICLRSVRKPENGDGVPTEGTA